MLERLSASRVSRVAGGHFYRYALASGGNRTVSFCTALTRSAHSRFSLAALVADHTSAASRPSLIPSCMNARRSRSWPEHSGRTAAVSHASAINVHMEGKIHHGRIRSTDIDHTDEVGGVRTRQCGSRLRQSSRRLLRVSSIAIAPAQNSEPADELFVATRAPASSDVVHV